MTSEKRWLDENLNSTLAELLESAAVDEPSPKAVSHLKDKLSYLFLIPPGGGGDGGGGGGGDGGSGDLGGGDHGGLGGVDSSHQMGGLDVAHGTTATVAAAGVKGGGLAAAGAATGGLASKTAITVAVATLSVGGAVGVGVTTQHKRATAAHTVVVAHPPPPPAIDLPSPAPPTPLAEEPVIEEVPPAPPPPVKAPRKAAPQTDDEMSLLQEAWRAPTPAEALYTAEQHRRQFPASPLAQEREVIAIEALVKLGQRSAAVSRLGLFRNQWPTSSHLVRLERLVQNP